MNSRLLLWVAMAAVFLGNACTQADEVKVIRVADYGAISNDGLDDTPAIQLALRACRGFSSARLVFGPGQYDCFPDRAPERYLFVSNNDEGLKRIAFPLSHFEKLEIDGQGAALVFRGWITPFVLDHAKGVTLKNFSVNWVRTFHSEGKILEVHDDGLTLAFSEAFPYEIRNGILVFTDFNSVHEQQTTVKGTELTYPYNGLLEFDMQKRETAYQALDYWGKAGVMAREVGERKVRITLPGITATVGNILLFGPSHRDCPGFVLSDSVDVTIDHVNLYHCGGMGVIAQRSRDITLDHLQVTPAPGSGRMVSITADATHFVNCAGKLTMSHCLFENQKDDATNIHGLYARVARLLAPHVLELERVHPQQYGVDFVVPGGKIELVHGPSLITYGESIVKAVEPVNKAFFRVILDKPVPSECVTGDVVAACDGYPETWIHHCVIRGNRGRGILLGSRGKMLIEDNEFHTAGAAILLEGDGRFWFEQAGVRNLVIRKNIFDNCNYGVWGNATIEVGAGIETACRATSRYNRNILIEENLFRTFGSGSLVRMYAVDGLAIRSNRVESTTAYPPLHPNAKRFDITDSDRIIIDPKE